MTLGRKSGMILTGNLSSPILFRALTPVKALPAALYEGDPR